MDSTTFFMYPTCADGAEDIIRVYCHVNSILCIQDLNESKKYHHYLMGAASNTVLFIEEYPCIDIVQFLTCGLI